MATLILWKPAARQLAALFDGNETPVRAGAVYPSIADALAADALPLLGQHADRYDLDAAAGDLFRFDAARGGWVPTYSDLLTLGDLLARHRR